MKRIVARRVSAVRGCRLDRIEMAPGRTALPLVIHVHGRGPGLHRARLAWTLDPRTHATREDVLASLDVRMATQHERLASAMRHRVGVGDDLVARGEIDHIHVDAVIHAIRVETAMRRGEPASTVIDAYRQMVDLMMRYEPGDDDCIASPSGRLHDVVGEPCLCMPTLIGNGLFDGERLRVPVDMPETLSIQLEGRAVAEIVQLHEALGPLGRRTVIRAERQPRWTTLHTHGDWTPIGRLTHRS